MSAISLVVIFAVLWTLQIAGTAWQMRHYRRVLARISSQWREGTAGVGNARGRIGRGIILIIVVGRDGLVREALAMRGRTVFATFKPFPELVGQALDDLRNRPPVSRDPGFSRALSQAIGQIDRLQEQGRAEIQSTNVVPLIAKAA